MSYEVVKDDNNIPQYIEMLKDLQETHIEIGIFGEDNEKYSDSGATILLIANVNEFGCNIRVTPRMRNYLHVMGLHLRSSTREIRIPERSFMRSGFDDREQKLRQQANKLLEQVLSMDLRPDTFFDLLGEYVVGQLQEYLTNIKKPANHPFTVASKGSSNPLVDTARLRDAITYKVRRR